MYIDEQLAETSVEPYMFNYGNSTTIQKMTIAGETENILGIFSESPQQSFKDFGTALIK